MGATIVAVLAFVAIFGGAVLGMVVRVALPSHHLSSSSRDVVRLCIAILATVSALVIGLLIASAKSSFDERTTSLRHFVAEALLFDRALAHIGPDAAPVRGQFREVVQQRLQEIWNIDGDGEVSARAAAQGFGFEAVQMMVLSLDPKTDGQRWLKERALTLLGDVAQTRWILVEQAGSSIQGPFLVILVVWLAVIFASFGLFSPRNATVLVVMAISAASIAGSLFLILEMDQPYEGLIRISQQSIDTVLERLGQP